MRCGAVQPTLWMLRSPGWLALTPARSQRPGKIPSMAVTPFYTEKHAAAAAHSFTPYTPSLLSFFFSTATTINAGWSAINRTLGGVLLIEQKKKNDGVSKSAPCTLLLPSKDGLDL